MLELVFPPRCAVCETLGREVICSECREQFELIEPPYCQRCGQKLPPEMGEGNFVCGQCRQGPPAFDAARSVGLHVGPLRRAVLKFKFAGRRQLLEPLGQLLADRVFAEVSQPRGLPWGHLTGIVPVPLHPRRRRWRGFDRALLLSHQLSTLIDVPYIEDMLIRHKDTAPQVGMTPTQRRANVQGAFAPSDSAATEGGSFLLIDDVFTTGSTLQAAARVLRRAGARAVYGLTLTRALPTWHPDKPHTPVRLGDEEDLPGNL